MINYLTRPVPSNLLLDASIAHVKVDGSGTHQTISEANSSSSVSIIFAYPGTHTVDNSAGPIALAKHLIGIGGRSVTTISRTTNTNVCFTTTAANRIIQSFTASTVDATPQSGSDAFFIQYDTALLSRSVISDLNILTFNGIKVRNANGLTLEKIYQVNVGVVSPVIGIQVGDSSGIPTLVIVKNCLFQFSATAGVVVYGGSVSIYNSIFTSAPLSGVRAGVYILPTSIDNRVSTNGCIFDGCIAPVLGTLGTSGGGEVYGTYTTNSDYFVAYSLYAVDLSGTGKFINVGTTYSYDPINLSNDLFNPSMPTTISLEGFYFDSYIGEQVNTADSRSYSRYPLLKYSNFFE